jgi:hypothetical protein
MEPMLEGHGALLNKLTSMLQLCLGSEQDSNESLSNSVLEAIGLVTKLSHVCKSTFLRCDAKERELVSALETLKKGYRLQKQEIESTRNKLGVITSDQGTSMDPVICSTCATKDLTIKQQTVLVSHCQSKVLELEQQLKKSKLLLEAQQVPLLFAL